MSHVKLKICGITSLKDARMVAELGVDWLGFNFFPGSLRYINPVEARDVIEKLPDSVQSIGILVKPTVDYTKKILEITGIQWVQIYEPQDFNDLSIIGAPVILCCNLNDYHLTLSKFRNADMILLDNYSKTEPGGTGKTFNWSFIPDSIPREKLVLAGGINPDNIQQALEQVSPAVIDVASGVEISPGKKDPKKIVSLIKQIRKYNQSQVIRKHNDNISS